MITGKLYPDYSFSVGIAPNQKIKGSDKIYEREENSQYSTIEFENEGKIEVFTPYQPQETLEYLGLEEYNQYKRFQGKYERLFFCLALFGRGIAPALSLSLVRNSRKRNALRKRYGAKGITSQGRRQVKCSAKVMEDIYGIKNLGFATFTLPNLSEEGLKTINTNWNTLINRFIEMLRRHLKSRNAPLDMVYVTEIQNKRFERLGQFALHLHLLYVCSGRDRNFYITANRLRDLWLRAIINILKKYGDLEEFSVKASVNCQRVKKSARGYLGKYMSKGQKEVNSLIEDGFSEYLPHQWWGRNNNLKKRVDRLTTSLDRSICYWLVELLKSGDFEGICEYLFPVNIVLRDGREIQIGLVGRFTENYAKTIYEPRF